MGAMRGLVAPLVAVVTLAALAAAVVACDPRPDEAACRAMLDHYVEMSARGEPAFASVPAAAVDDRLREIVASKRTEPVYASAVDRCRRETSGSAFACAMKAPSPNEWEACVQ
jgi:hypothetical protein